MGKKPFFGTAKDNTYLPFLGSKAKDSLTKITTIKSLMVKYFWQQTMQSYRQYTKYFRSIDISVKNRGEK